ncbi:twin-arginine translocase subunit TatC [Geosporobacter ferrireducens]|uniref:Sec-independent protein translocase protein TatC n=1 Tax=Geosporobacter ferrireducens TaxID=1424294 RepID=A0A1D8GL54_9FIRM|nr:twin-arginine translocase subunit TatC [Geosporobacter ferrireducens]AOT71637.1 twin arginine-targeting protein translocase TatC [Geosporobacter ferrireducens]MTI55403.1 twin-arginine translocase subunit TatC [Geosporobacter ferrireducens]
MTKQEEMSILDHLDELRKGLIFCLLAVLVCSALAYIKAPEIIGLLKAPLGDIDLVFITPAEGFMTRIKAAFFGGIVFASPLIFLQTMLFIAPALYKKEKIILFSCLPFVILFFGSGIVFSFQFLMPMTLQYLLSFGDGLMEPMLSASKYFSFVMGFTLGLGLVFELPMVLLMLSRFGIVDYRLLAKNRKYMILLIAVLSAVITPPDAVSQLAVALPLLFLFELSLGLMFIFHKITQRRSIKANEEL